LKEEKMMILSMLEEGKITSQEAIKLMEALEDIEFPKETQNIKEEKDEKHKEREVFKPIFNSLEDIGSDIGSALSNMFEGLKGIGNSFNFIGNYETVVTDLDMDLSGIENPSLDFKAINGSIKLRPADDNKLIIKSTCKYKNGLLNLNEPYFDFYADENKIIFNPKYNSNISISLDVFVPKQDYDEIILHSSNGKIDIEELNTNILKCVTNNSSIDILDVNSKEMDLSTKNSRIECRDTRSIFLKATTSNSNIYLIDVIATEIDAKTANAKIVVNDIDAFNVVLKTSNSPIEVEDITCDIINLTTSNSKIDLDNIDIDRVKEVELHTSNGSINLEINKTNRDIYFDLETSIGNISLEIPDLVYKINKQANLGFRKIVAHSANFDESQDSAKFIASTSNGSIKIY
jgi:DUF4097 and DUF4098 domain-containing protein YvlB